MFRLSALIPLAFLSSALQAAEPKTPPAAASAAAPGLPPDQAAGAMLKETFGEKGLALLTRRGYAGVQERDGRVRIQFLHWTTLEELQRVAPSVPELSQAAQRFLADNPVGAGQQTPAFMPLSRLPSSGLMTPVLHALLDILSGAHAEEALTPGKAFPEGENFFETPWGASLAARTHGDLLDDPQPLLKPFFEAFIASPRAHSEAAAHFTAFAKAVYDKDVSPILEADARSGNASEELRAWLRKYLSDSRRAFALKRLRDSVRKLDSKAGFSKDLEDLELIAAALRDHPDALSGMRRALEASAPAPSVRLTSVGIHRHAPERLGRHELGDVVTVTGGYWVDGLPEGESLEVEETSLADRGPQGAEAVETRSVSRKNGGPYILRRELPLKDSRGFTFRWLAASFDSNALAEAIEVPVGSEFEASLAKLAAADQQNLSCDPKGADEAYAAVEEATKEPALSKKQYADLAAAAKAGRLAAAKIATALSALEAAVEKARPDSSPEQCSYLPARTEEALKLAAALPPGCDRFLPELTAQLTAIQRRRADQATFSLLSAKGSALLNDCKFSSAAETWAEALAVLDADPAARCGAASRAADKLEGDLAAARAAALWKNRLEGEVKSAELEEVKDPSQGAAAPDSALSILRRVQARIPTLPREGCFSRERERASRLASLAGESLPPPDDSAALAKLPNDKSWSRTADEVLANRREEEAARAARDARQSAEQAPVPSQAAVPPPVESEEVKGGKFEKPRKPAIKPKRKTSPARKKPAKTAPKTDAEKKGGR